MLIQRALAGLSAEQAEQIEAIAERKSYGFGESIISQGERLDRLFVIAGGMGRVTLHQGNTPDSEFTGPLGPGELFGELSFVDGQPTSASVTADGDAEVIEIPGEALRAILDADPALAAAFYKCLLTTVGRRLRQANHRIVNTPGPI